MFTLKKLYPMSKPKYNQYSWKLGHLDPVASHSYGGNSGLLPSKGHPHVTSVFNTRRRNLDRRLVPERLDRVPWQKVVESLWALRWEAPEGRIQHASSCPHQLLIPSGCFSPQACLLELHKGCLCSHIWMQRSPAQKRNFSVQPFTRGKNVSARPPEILLHLFATPKASSDQSRCLFGAG